MNFIDHIQARLESMEPYDWDCKRDPDSGCQCPCCECEGSDDDCLDDE
jgi:hypothetical protein